MTAAAATLHELAPGSHVCWVVTDAGSYVENASAVLRAGAGAHEKTVVFGPEGSQALSDLAPLAVESADPRVAFLDDGPLDAERMFAMFREQTARAHAEGYERLCVVADMDWLLPAAPTTAEIVAFELLLDREVRELDATIVCAYRAASFDTDVIDGSRCVHPMEVGAADDAPFRIVAADDGTWTLSGEVDVAVADHFATVMHTASGAGGCVIDVSGLAFADVASMRTIATASEEIEGTLRLVGTQPVIRRSWQLSGFAEAAPRVVLA